MAVLFDQRARARPLNRVFGATFTEYLVSKGAFLMTIGFGYAAAVLVLGVILTGTSSAQPHPSASIAIGQQKAPPTEDLEPWQQTMHWTGCAPAHDDPGPLHLPQGEEGSVLVDKRGVRLYRVRLPYRTEQYAWRAYTEAVGAAAEVLEQRRYVVDVTPAESSLVRFASNETAPSFEHLGREGRYGRRYGLITVQGSEVTAVYGPSPEAILSFTTPRTE